MNSIPVLLLSCLFLPFNIVSPDGQRMLLWYCSSGFSLSILQLDKWDFENAFGTGVSPLPDPSAMLDIYWLP